MGDPHDPGSQPQRAAPAPLPLERIRALREVIRKLLVELASPGERDPDRELELLDELGHRLNQLGLLVPHAQERSVAQMALVAAETRRLYEAIGNAGNRNRQEHYLRLLMRLLVTPAMVVEDDGD